MSAQIQPFIAESAKQLCDQLNRLIRKYESGQISIQVITTVVADPKRADQSKVQYEAFVTYPAS